MDSRATATFSDIVSRAPAMASDMDSRATATFSDIVSRAPAMASDMASRAPATASVAAACAPMICSRTFLRMTLPSCERGSSLMTTIWRGSA